jgi:hypothetical protein
MDGLPARARSVRGEGGLRDLDHQLRSAPLRQLAGPAFRPVVWLGAALPACLPACLEPAICCCCPATCNRLWDGEDPTRSAGTV